MSLEIRFCDTDSVPSYKTNQCIYELFRSGPVFNMLDANATNIFRS